MRTLKFSEEPRYTIDRTKSPPSCLPSYIDASTLIDCTRASDAWRRYIDPATGAIHDGVDYHNQLVELIERHS